MWKRILKGYNAMSRVPKDMQEGASNDLSVWFLWKMLSPRAKVGVYDVSDCPARVAMEHGIISLAVTEQKDSVTGFEVSAVGQKDIQTLLWKMLEAATFKSYQPYMRLLKQVTTIR